MTHFLIAGFVVAHGAVHGVMFGLPLIPKAKADMAADGFLPSNSWLIGERPLVAFVFGVAVTIAFLVAGAAFQWRVNWWPGAMLGAAGASLLLLALFASKWFVIGYPISIALAIAAWQAQTTAE